MQYYILQKVHSPMQTIQCQKSTKRTNICTLVFNFTIEYLLSHTLCFKDNHFLCRPETNTRIIEDIPLWSSLTIIEIAKSDNKGKGRKTAQSMMHTAQRAKYFVVLTVWSKYDGHSTAHWSSVNKKILDVLGRLTTFRSDAIHFTVLHSISLKCRT